MIETYVIWQMDLDFVDIKIFFILQNFLLK